MSETKGEFLHHKMINMARWVTQEVGKENLSVDIIADIAGRSALEATVLCAALEANEHLVTHKNWSGIVQLMAQHGASPGLQEVMVLVQKRDAMHDKFWRYMQLFVEVSSQ